MQEDSTRPGPDWECVSRQAIESICGNCGDSAFPQQTNGLSYLFLWNQLRCPRFCGVHLYLSESCISNLVPN